MSAFLLFLKERRVKRAPFFGKERGKERAPEIRGATNALDIGIDSFFSSTICKAAVENETN